jgi:hypothetical protein
VLQAILAAEKTRIGFRSLLTGLKIGVLQRELVEIGKGDRISE